MTSEFWSVPKPAISLIKTAAESEPTNPFYTAEYARACESLGRQTWLLGIQKDGRLSACLGFLSGGLLRRTLDLPSIPEVPDPAIFWRGIVEVCRGLKIWRLQLGSYASHSDHAPRLLGELDRRVRCEHVLDLTAEDLSGGVSSQHRRSQAKASRAGLSIRRTGDPSACAQHLELVAASMDRRVQRGEKTGHVSVAMFRALLGSGCGEIFQATQSEQVLSSILVLKSQKGAYYQSAGTSPEGMKIGASAFLILGVAALLKEEGSTVFNLGGATTENPGLHRFKAGFGAREVALESASFCPRSVAQRTFHTVLRSCWALVKQH